MVQSGVFVLIIMYWNYLTYAYILGCSDSDNGMDSDEDEDNNEEIENLLDSALPEELKNKKREYEERFKIIMEGKDDFQIFG